MTRFLAFALFFFFIGFAQADVLVPPPTSPPPVLPPIPQIEPPLVGVELCVLADPFPENLNPVLVPDAQRTVTEQAYQGLLQIGNPANRLVAVKGFQQLITTTLKGQFPLDTWVSMMDYDACVVLIGLDDWRRKREWQAAACRALASAVNQWAFLMDISDDPLFTQFAAFFGAEAALLLGEMRSQLFGQCIMEASYYQLLMPDFSTSVYQYAFNLIPKILDAYDIAATHPFFTLVAEAKHQAFQMMVLNMQGLP